MKIPNSKCLPWSKPIIQGCRNRYNLINYEKKRSLIKQQYLPLCRTRQLFKFVYRFSELIKKSFRCAKIRDLLCINNIIPVSIALQCNVKPIQSQKMQFDILLNILLLNEKPCTKWTLMGFFFTVNSTMPSKGR